MKYEVVRTFVDAGSDGVNEPGEVIERSKEAAEPLLRGGLVKSVGAAPEAAVAGPKEKATKPRPSGARKPKAPGKK